MSLGRARVDPEVRPEPTEVEAPLGVPSDGWSVYPGKELTLAAIDRRAAQSSWGRGRHQGRWVAESFERVVRVLGPSVVAVGGWLALGVLLPTVAPEMPGLVVVRQFMLTWAGLALMWNTAREALRYHG